MARRVDEEQKSNVSNEVIASFGIELQRAQREIDEATGRKRSVVKRAKAAGVDTAALGKALALKKQDDDAVQMEMRNTLRYVSIIAPSLPLRQEDLFGGLDVKPLNAKAQAELQEADAEEQGYQAGLHGGSKEDCEAAPGTPVFAAFGRGWLRGQRVIADRMAANGGEDGPKEASQSRTKKRGKAAAAADDTETADRRQEDLETAISRGTA